MSAPERGSAISAAVETALLRESAIRLTAPGRRTGRPHEVTLWFVYRDGALHFLAHAREHRRGTDWYRNFIAAGAAEVQAGGQRATIRPAAFPPGVDPYRHTVALFEAKYGTGAIDTWYDPALRIPVRATLAAP